MANIKDKALYFVGNKLLKYVYKNPQKNMLKLVKLGKAVAGKMYPESTFTKPIEIISDETNVWLTGLMILTLIFSGRQCLLLQLIWGLTVLKHFAKSVKKSIAIFLGLF